MAKFRMPKWVFQVFKGTKYCIEFESFDALCDTPKVTKDDIPVILFPNGFQPTRRGLELLLHECLHACNWNKTEERVEQTAEEIANLLWKLYKPRIKK